MNLHKFDSFFSTKNRKHIALRRFCCFAAGAERASAGGGRIFPRPGFQSGARADLRSPAAPDAPVFDVCPSAGCWRGFTGCSISHPQFRQPYPAQVSNNSCRCHEKKRLYPRNTLEMRPMENSLLHRRHYWRDTQAQVICIRLTVPYGTDC